MLAEEVSRRLKAAGVRPSKQRSQHFLIDDMTLATIIRQANLSEDDTVPFAAHKQDTAPQDTRWW